jgi:phosphoribosylformylglycinamidine synthase
MATGTNTADLDFDSVQRGNPEMERRAQEVINAAGSWAEEPDHLDPRRAGGLSNAFPEITNDAKRGAIFDLRKIPLEESGMAPKEIWSNESQERYVLAIAGATWSCSSDLRARALPVRRGRRGHRRAPAEAGRPGTGQQPGRHADGSAAGQAAQDAARRAARAKRFPAVDLTGMDLEEAAKRVLLLPTVGDKSFLITIGDRTVGGMSVRDQMVGPWQVPVADCAVTAMSLKATWRSDGHGRAHAAGRDRRRRLGPHGRGEAVPTSPPRRSVRSKTSSCRPTGWRPAASLARTPRCTTPSRPSAWNCARRWASPSRWARIRCPCAPPGKTAMSEGRAVAGVADRLLVRAGVRRAQIADAAAAHRPGDTSIILIDLGRGKNRMGASALAQVMGQLGNRCRTSIRKTEAFFAAIQQLNADGKLLAYHDRSDGGLYGTLTEMAFAGRRPVDQPRHPDAGRGPRRRPRRCQELGHQVAERRNEQTLRALFSEELGAVIQVRADEKSP